LAISWSDRLVDVVSTETGAVLQNFRQVTTPDKNADLDEKTTRSGSVQCLGWGLSLVDPYPNQSAKKRFKTQSPNVDPDAFLDREPNLDALGFALDFPDQLASFDATELMPKLPILPVVQTPGRTGKQPTAEVFASQASIDAVLHKGVSQELHAVNTFLLTEPEGSLRVILYDALGIGNVPLGSSPPSARVRYLRHASHPMAHCHTLLSEISLPGNSTQLALIPLAMRFLRFAGKNVHFIDFKTSQLEMLVLYVGECLQSIHHHWKNSRDLPSRFQQNIEETLEENKEPNLVQSLAQLAAMGYCTPAMKEWITDELGDRVC
jgi:anaphase-promoting complex subunit 4